MGLTTHASGSSDRDRPRFLSAPAAHRLRLRRSGLLALANPAGRSKMTMRAYGSGGAGLFPTSVAGFENRAGRFRFVNFSEKWSVLTSMSARVRGRVFPSLVLTGVYPVTESPVLPPDCKGPHHECVLRSNMPEVQNDDDAGTEHPRHDRL